MKFHKEGYPTLILTLIFSAIILLLGTLSGSDIVFRLSIALGVFLLIVVLQFFRSPKRTLPVLDNDLVYTPADGKVVVIEKVFEKEFIKSECWQVSVFMSPLNVHINRNPVSAKVEYLKYHPGKYLVAWHPKSSEENERFTTVYKLGSSLILIRQIAGALARRIVNNLNEGQDVKQGEEMGFIKFGSRVDIFLPLDAEILVSMDQVVKSPLDAIAKLNNKA